MRKFTQHRCGETLPPAARGAEKNSKIIPLWCMASLMVLATHGIAAATSAPSPQAGSENAMAGVLHASATLSHAATPAAIAVEHPEIAPSLAENTGNIELQKALSDYMQSGEANTLSPQLADMYAANNYQPLWIEKNTFTEQAQAAIARIRNAQEDGLDPAHYPLPSLDKTATPLEMAKAEILLSQSIATYALHAQSGRIAPQSISKLITAVPEQPSAPVSVMRVATSKNAAATLDSFNPPHAEFKALKEALKQARQHSRPSEKPFIPAGQVLRQGQSDPRVPLIRAHLNVTEPAEQASAQIYDLSLAEAVKTFQKANNLKASGVIGQQTIAAFNAEQPKDDISTILVNMERWRWVPRDFGRFYVIVNVPEYMGRVMRDGDTVHEMRVIVGSVKNQTPLFSHVMDHMVVNPYWHIPRSIAMKEMLPKLRSDPSYLARQGIEVVRVANGRQQVVNSTMIDWSANNISGLHFRQPPGERNALGRIKFMFPNEHAVYLHDTPGRHLFSQGQRAMSHGCVRVQDPFALAEALQGPQNAKRLRSMIGGSEKRINLSDKPNVHLVYFTRWIENGKTVSRPDIYGHDSRMKAALALK